MRLIYDIRHINNRTSGGSFYTLEVLRALIRSISNFPCYEYELYLLCFPNQQINFEEKFIYKRKVSTKEKDVDIVNDLSPDKLIIPIPNFWFGKLNYINNDITIIEIIHDIRHLHNNIYLTQLFRKPKLRSLPKIMVGICLDKWRKMITNHKLRSDLTREKLQIVTPSHFTKYKLIQHFEINEKNISVFWPPPLQCFESARNNKNKSETKVQYLLVINAERYIKDADAALLAFQRLPEKYKSNIQLILVGCGNRIKTKCRHLKNVVCKPIMPEEELEILYSNAKAFIFPSLCEGFGYPIIHALAYGTRVIATGTSALPEVAQESAWYFKPGNSDELASLMIRAVVEDNHKFTPERYYKIIEKQNNDLKDLISLILN